MFKPSFFIFLSICEIALIKREIHIKITIKYKKKKKEPSKDGTFPEIDTKSEFLKNKKEDSSSKELIKSCLVNSQVGKESELKAIPQMSLVGLMGLTIDHLHLITQYTIMGLSSLAANPMGLANPLNPVQVQPAIQEDFSKLPSKFSSTYN